MHPDDVRNQQPEFPELYAKNGPRVIRGYVDKALFLAMVRKTPRKVGEDIQVTWCEEDYKT